CPSAQEGRRRGGYRMGWPSASMDASSPRGRPPRSVTTPPSSRRIWAAMTDLLTLEAMSVDYGKRRALEGVSLSIGGGEIVTLLGANGSGKSTTLRAISGLGRPRAGRGVFDGRDNTPAAPDAIAAAAVVHAPRGRHVVPQLTRHK